jgi:hypothetical protein
MSEEEEKAEFGMRIFRGVPGEPTATDKFRLASPPATGNDLSHSTFTQLFILFRLCGNLFVLRV